MSVIAISAGSSSAYLQELQFTAAAATATETAILQAGSIQAAYVLASATDAAMAKASYAHATEARLAITTAIANTEKATAAQLQNVLATADQSAEALRFSEIQHHHYHHGGAGPASETDALTLPETPSIPGASGLDTSA